MRLRRWKLDLNAAIGLAILVLWVLVAAAGPAVLGGDPNGQELEAALVPPVWQDGGSADHLLGTDQLGRDILLRVVHGARSSLAIGLIAVAGSAVLGSLIGVAAAQG